MEFQLETKKNTNIVFQAQMRAIIVVLGLHGNISSMDVFSGSLNVSLHLYPLLFSFLKKSLRFSKYPNSKYSLLSADKLVIPYHKSAIFLKPGLLQLYQNLKPPALIFEIKSNI